MNYKEAYSWLVNQEDWTEKEICDVLNSEGSGKIIQLAQILKDECDKNSVETAGFTFGPK